MVGGGGTVLDGSIPACAGEPGLWTCTPYRHTVYPRVCGGTSANRSMSRLALGLSPRVRGNHDLTGNAVQSIRSIPACAGEPPA